MPTRPRSSSSSAAGWRRSGGATSNASSGPGTDGLLLEVDSGDPSLLPELTLRSDAQLFSGDPMSVAVGDP